MKVITLLNEKGGCGKTSLATHLAAGLALRGRTVVLVDADPQGNSTSAVSLNKRPIFHDLCVRGMDWKDALELVHPDVYSPRDAQSTGRLFCVPGNNETFSVAGMMKSRAVIRRRFAELNGRVDYIIVDTSPSPSMLHEAIAAASNYILIPTECEVFSSFEGMPDTIEHTGRVSEAGAERDIQVAKLLGIVPSKYLPKSALHREVLEALQVEYGDLVWNAIPESMCIPQSQARKQFLYSLYPRNSVTQEMWRIVDRVEATVWETA